MTYTAGTQLDLTEACDKILEYFYFRKSSAISLDDAQIELKIAYERFDIAVQQLEQDGLLKITKTKSGWFARITSSGQVFYRTTSYQKTSAQIRTEKRRTRFKYWFEIILGIVTAALTISTFILENKLSSYQEKVDKLIYQVNALKEEISSIKTIKD